MNRKVNGDTDKFLILHLFLLNFRWCFTLILTENGALK